MITIIDHKKERGGLWEATFNGKPIAVRAYLYEQEKYEMLKECIERAKNNIPVTIEVAVI